MRFNIPVALVCRFIAVNRGASSSAANSDMIVGGVLTPPILPIILISAIAKGQAPPSNGGAGQSTAPVLIAAASSSSQINLIWTPVTGDVTYTVNRATKSAADGGKKRPVGNGSDLTDVSFSDTPLDANKQFFYSVDVLDADQIVIATSNEVSATTDAGVG